MSPTGDLPPEGEPDDPASSREWGDAGGPEQSETGQGGLPPLEGRQWRHPSELAGASGFAPAAGSPAGVAARPGLPQYEQVRRHRRRLRLMGAVGAGAAAAAVAGVALLWTSGGSETRATLSTVTSQTGSLPTTALAATRALVSLRVATGGHATTVCGVVVSAGGLVAAPADALQTAGARVSFTDGDRQEPARVVSMDPSSGVALVRVPADLPAPRFSDDGRLTPGSHVLVVAAGAGNGSGSNGPNGTVWSTGTVDAVATSVPTGDAKGMAGIAVTAAAASGVPGALLLDSTGAVLGILDRTDSGPDGSGVAGTTDFFLPEILVVGVTHELAASGVVRHGWLDVSGRTATTSSRPGSRRVEGAVIATVEPQGAAAGALHSGDVIVGVSGAPVRSMAELRTRLYVLPPGSPVTLDVARGGRDLTVSVELSGSP